MYQVWRTGLITILREKIDMRWFLMEIEVQLAVELNSRERSGNRHQGIQLDVKAKQPQE